MIELVDTHAHLYDPTLCSQLDSVLARARQANVTQALVIGTDLENSRWSVEIAAAHPEVFAVIGFQPNHCHELTGEDWQELKRLVDNPKVVGVGETGLDRYWDDCPFETQWTWFERHVEFARERDLPVVVHMRDCEEDIVRFLEAHRALWPISGVMHSFTGNQHTAEACLAAGMHISFAGMVTFKASEALRAVARGVPDERLLVETDSPYLSPEPFRGKKPNEPARVRFTAECLAGVRGVDLETLATITTRNARSLFRLPSPESRQ